SKTLLKVGLVYGGVDIKGKTEQLRKGVEILIATPGRLLDHLEQRNTSLNNVEILILDEADRMLDMGFLPDIISILQKVPDKRQNLMFSATFSPDIKKLAKQFLNSPEIVEVARQNTTATGIDQHVFLIHQSQKTDALVEILRKNDLASKGEKQQAIIFVNAKITARRLASQLERLGMSVEAMHGDKTQEERNTILQSFKDGNVQYLVATDVAARGLDIPEIPFVFNYDVPFTPEDYVHRIGRTGRAGAKGTAVTLTTSADERNLRAIERLIKKTLDRTKINPRRIPIPRFSSPLESTYKPVEKVPLDPLFTQPYVPSGNATKSNLLPTISPMRKKSNGKKPVAKLLGGTGKRIQKRTSLRRGL
ncbi:MAG: DEAD/DEAH box helicase, partial [Burkholderiales bacterium]|nr:DEAD/DEAH box helicase [Burkholderiales bacterium]